MIAKVILATALLISINGTAMSQKRITQTAGRDALGEFAPEFAKINDDIIRHMIVKVEA